MTHAWTEFTAKGIGGRSAGAPDRSRTCNLLIRSQVLYPLSYGRENYLGQRREHRDRMMTGRARYTGLRVGSSTGGRRCLLTNAVLPRIDPLIRTVRINGISVFANSHQSQPIDINFQHESWFQLTPHSTDTLHHQNQTRRDSNGSVGSYY